MMIAFDVVVVAIVALNLVGLALSRSWQVARTVASSAAPADVYPLIASLQHGWSRWSPSNDPKMNTVYEGPVLGAGATQSWTGGETGKGRIAIVQADGAEQVGYELAFGGFKIAGRIELRDDQITWTNVGTIAGPPMFRIGRLFAERVVGKAMERGLADLVVASVASAH